MRTASQNAITYDQPTSSFHTTNRGDAAVKTNVDSDFESHEETDAHKMEDQNRLHAHMIVETMTPFLGVLIGLQPDRPPSR